MFNTMNLPPRCPPTQNYFPSQAGCFPGTQVPKPGQGFWSIASPFYENPASEERNVRLGNSIAPPGPEVSLKNEQTWLNSDAGRISEVLREFGYPAVSCGRMNPLLYKN